MFKKTKTYPAIDLFLQSHLVLCFFLRYIWCSTPVIQYSFCYKKGSLWFCLLDVKPSIFVRDKKKRADLNIAVLTYFIVVHVPLVLVPFCGHSGYEPWHPWKRKVTSTQYPYDYGLHRGFWLDGNGNLFSGD
jgi:hypothetical protein